MMLNEKIRLLLALLLLSIAPSSHARSHISDPNVKTLQTVVNGNWLSPAVMRLNSDDVLTISFDELSHDYHRYTYQIEHCEADWTPSEGLFESDWLEGFNGNTIDDYEHSSGTIIPYTHYQLQLPNSRCRLKLSGNYRLHVIDEDDDNCHVLTAEFMVTEQSMRLSMGVTTDTDIDTRHSKQQVEMTLNYLQLPVTNPREQIYAVVMQNAQDRDMKRNVEANITTLSGLEWRHNSHLIFDAGNEYRKFEVLDVSHPTMGIDHIMWDGENYQVYPFVDEPRPNYLYDEDANGAFCIRNSDDIENDTQSQYVWVNYRLKSPAGQDVRLSGRWTVEQPDTYRMSYDTAEGFYTASILQKQGYYSYQYLCGDDHNLLPSEGNFYQTENQYQAFIYYKGTTDRSWRLTAYAGTAVE